MATGTALVNVGGEVSDEPFWLSFGDVVALTGDFFSPDGPSGLFHLAHRPGHLGLRADTRDELVCALKVSTLDEGVVDHRFDVGGQFERFRFSPGANLTDVERRVRDRFLALAATNDDHFVAPGPSDARTGSGSPSAASAYQRLHRVALDEAWRTGRDGGDVSRAMAREAAAQHYLTDAFAAGHLRTPVASIRRYWALRHPDFWAQLQGRVASDTARALRQLSRLVRMLPERFVSQRTLSELTRRTSQYPELSVGDLVARVFHDWDNTHGLAVEGGMVFGDGQIGEGLTQDLALAAARAGIDDIEVAFELGRKSARPLGGESLYAAVREATNAAGDAFVAEERLPRLTADNPSQNWKAPDAESLWESPMVGSHGTTAGEALIAMLEPGQQFIRQVQALGQGLAGTQGVFAVPLLGAWLSRKCCHAYLQGFVEPLAHDPKQLLGLTGRAAPVSVPGLVATPAPALA